jgi:predicted metal-dependent hydrolase
VGDVGAGVAACPLTCALVVHGLWTKSFLRALEPGVRVGGWGYLVRVANSDAPLPAGKVPAVEVRRSGRRRRTVAAYRDQDRIVVLIPARMSRAEEKHWVAAMVERLERQERRRRPSQTSLEQRARELSRRFLDGRAQPVSVRWVGNQRARWGSCTPADGTIRLSSRLQGMPEWVIDYVLLHELAHLLEPGHGKRFWALLQTYPRTERARGYLEGVAAASGLELPGEEVD